MRESPNEDPRRAPDPASRSAGAVWGDRFFGIVLLAATLIAYQRVWHAGFIWDDDAHVTRPNLRSLHGLWRIWTEPGATQQYYPLLHGAFWLEHRIWGGSALGYHIANVALHAGAAYLLLRVLRALGIPGARIAAAVFALHPVCAESVAWISEQKNTLSALFCLSAALAHIRFDRERRAPWYALGTGLFILSLLSKSVTATLPGALLVILWWKRGRLSLRGDVLPLAPWLALGAGAGVVTSWMERTYVGASGAPYELSLVERMLVAGRALWFYLGKIVWPTDLAFIYPRWAIDSHSPVQYAYPAAAAAAAAVLWAYRSRGRGPLATALLFAGTLFPALGFISIFPFIYSYVADHFQYLAAAIVISATVAALTLAAGHLPRGLRRAPQAAACFVVALLGFLTWRQCAMYADMETLWRTTIFRNPSCWMAYNNLAAALVRDGRIDEAKADIRESLRYAPENAAAYVTLGDALSVEGSTAEAFAEYRRALEIEPNNVLAHNNLASALLHAGRVDEALSQFSRALELKPDLAKANAGLGDALLQSGRTDEAIAQFRRALELDPEDAQVLTNLGSASAQKGLLAEAISDFKRALQIKPGFATARINLGNALLQTGRNDEAVEEFHRSLELDPNSSAAHNGLGFGYLEAGRTGEAIAEFRKALEIDPNNAGARRNLDGALLRR